MELEKGQILPIDSPLESEHWHFVLNHPAFVADLEMISEEIEDVYPDIDLSDLTRAALTDPMGDWPAVRTFSAKWGLPPSALIVFAAISPSKIDDLDPGAVEKFRQEAQGLVVTESEAEFIVRIPRPFTKAKQTALQGWLKSTPTDGPREVAWDRKGKSKEVPSKDLEEAIPWFLKWNGKGDEEPGEEPAAIWRDLTKPNGEYRPATLKFQKVYDDIVGVWKRMMLLSPDQIRQKRPSKKRA